MTELEESIEQVQALVPDESVQSKPSRQSPKTRRISSQPLVVLVLIMGFSMAVLNQFEALFGPAEATLTADARALLLFADSELQAEMIMTGVVPEALPPAVSSQLIAYSPELTGYSLTVLVNGQLQRLERKGSEVTFDDE